MQLITIKTFGDNKIYSFDSSSLIGNETVINETDFGNSTANQTIDNNTYINETNQTNSSLMNETKSYDNLTEITNVTKNNITSFNDTN